MKDFAWSALKDLKSACPVKLSNRLMLFQTARTVLPEDCPVDPLGHFEDISSYLDSCRQIVRLKSEKHTRLNIESLFIMNMEWLERHYGRYTKRGDFVGIQIEEIGRDLRHACALLDIRNPETRIRGVGSWLDSDRNLIMHCGNKIWYRGRFVKPSVIDGHVYPALPAIPAPLNNPSSSEDDPGGEIFNELAGWNWKRGKLDVGLMIGWIVASLAGSVLSWRPTIWITGEKGTGKSTVHEVLKHFFGDGVVATSDATPAGIWQRLKNNSVPVILDEQEAEAERSRSNSLLKLARQAGSGGAVLRGGADHNGSEFKVLSCFMFSSILVPPLLPQDRSRITVLQLEKLINKTPPNLSEVFWRHKCRQLKRRLVDQWARFDQTLKLYREALMDLEHEPRGADQLGTLLASFDLAMFDTVPDEGRLHTWTKDLRPEDVDEAIDDGADWSLCQNHLLESIPQFVRSGERLNVLELIRKAAEDSEGNFSSTDGEAAKVLARIGLRLHIEMKPDIPERPKGSKGLAVAYGHTGLGEVFDGTHWGTMPGSQSGGWAQSLRRAPGATIKNVRIQEKPVRCVVLPWPLIFDDEPS